MTEVFAHKYDGAIWKMELNETAALLAIEWRDQDGLPYFSVIHYPSGRLLADRIQYGDRWWTLAGVHHHQLLLQHYPQPNIGQTQGLVAIDIDSEKVSWELFNVQFIELVQEGIAVKQRFDNVQTVSLVDPSSGSMLKDRQLLNELAPLFRNIRSAAPAPPSSLFPFTSTQVGPYFFLENKEKEFWAYHEKNGDKLRVILTIVQAGVIQHRECIIDHLDYLLPEVFFMVDQQLFFVRNNKREIVSYFV
ncbi:DUF4905 domain-containing protein [Olivibacter sp. CPCC 100613]|uniref:DUF4905 domain-containing protein n=1 Tax=Olivibacter sp. CPCC 100613 TaxID=3079931 RepID=UPI002FFA18E8